MLPKKKLTAKQKKASDAAFDRRQARIDKVRASRDKKRKAQNRTPRKR